MTICYSSVDALAKKLNRFGINRADRVAIALPSGIEMIVSFLATTVAATAAPLNPGYKLDEFRFFLEDTSARALIVPPRGMEEAKCAAGDKTLIIVADLNGHGRVYFGNTDYRVEPWGLRRASTHSHSNQR